MERGARRGAGVNRPVNTGRSPCSALHATKVAGVLFFVASLGFGQPGPLEDPLPLQRVQIPVQRIPIELERARQGILVQMPRADFEAKVQQAAQAMRGKNLPRLVKASYAAELQGSVLVGGRGHWTIVNPGAAPAILPVADFNLALSALKNDQAKPGVLGELNGNLGLWVEKPGSQEFFLDWSLRGQSGPQGLHFAMRVPPSPVAELELTLPREFQVTVPRDGAMLSAPGKTGKWRLHFSGRSTVEFVVRRHPGSGSLPPLLINQVQARQQLFPERLLADFDFHLEVLHQGIQQLEFDGDPDLEPFEVVALAPDAAHRLLDVQSWEFQEPPAKDPKAKEGARVPGKLVVHLREPFQGGPAVLRVRCLAPVPAGGRWTSPGLRLQNALLRGETLKLKLPADVVLEKWDAGAFRLSNGGSEADGGQTLILTTHQSAAPRPHGIVKSQGADFLARQRTWWQIGASHTHLTSEIAYEIQRGKLFQLACKLPKAGKWVVESVQMHPKDLLRGWVTTGSMVLVDLRRPVTVQAAAKLTLRLRGAQAIGPREATLDFPDLEPEIKLPQRGGRLGTLAISVDPLYQAAAVPATYLSSPQKDGPWGSDTPLFFFAFRGQPPPVKLRLAPHPPRFQANCRTEVTLAASGAGVKYELELDRVSGNPDHLDLFLSASLGGPWQWKGVEVRAVERRPVFEALPALLAELGFLPSLPRGQYWRLTLARPIGPRETLIGQTVLAPPANAPWEIPLLEVLNAERTVGEVHLVPVSAKILDLNARGMQEIKAPPVNSAQANRVYRYGHQDATFPRLHLAIQPVTQGAWSRELCDHAHLTTCVQPDRPLLHHFRFQVWNWQQRDFPVLLPAGAQVLAARIDGRWVRQIQQHHIKGQVQVLLPAGGDAVPHGCEIFYQTDSAGSSFFPWGQAAAPFPQLPLEAVSVRRTWRLAPGLLPVSRQNLRCCAGQNCQDPRGKVAQLWHSGDALLTPLGLASDDWLIPQRQLLTGAETKLRQKLPAEGAVGKILEEFVGDHLKGPTILVLDGAALQDLGLRPDTRIPFSADKPFWEKAGLVYVPCRSGPLLTSRQVLDAWQQARGTAAGFAAYYDAAVADAARFGSDRAGRFVTVDHWLGAVAGASDSGFAENGLHYFVMDRFSPDWTEWEPQAGAVAADSLLLVAGTGVRLAGLVGALVLGILAWSLRDYFTPTWRFRLLVCWVGTAALAYFWSAGPLRELAGWLLASGLVFLLAVYGQMLRQPSLPPARGSKITDKTIKAATTAVLLLFLLRLAVAPPAGAQAPEPSTVFLVPGPSNAPEQQRVLVAPDLLKRLEDLSRRGAAAPRQAVVFGASYQGKAVGAGADFTGKFLVYSFADQASLSLPLGGVDLRGEVFLDGFRVFPLALAGGAGYSLPVSGKGPHSLELSFYAPFSRTGDELKFNIPKLAQSRLELSFPDSLQGISLGMAQGDWRLRREGKSQVVSGHLGREKTVLVQWRREARPKQAPQVQVEETYFADLRILAPTITGLLSYTVNKGAVSQLTLALPEGLEVRQVEVNGESGMGELQLKSWDLVAKAGSRFLRLDLAQPATGKVQVKLLLFPRQALTPGPWTLHFPMPLGVKHVEGFLAYRLEGMEAAEKKQNLGVTSMPAERFAKAAKGLDLGKVVPTRAYSFRRTTANAALVLNLTKSRPQATPHLVWRVHRHHADWTARVQWQAAAEDLLLVEAELPPAVTLTSVQGPQVRHWLRSEGLVQIWLDKPYKEVTLNLGGYVKLPAKKIPGQISRFVVPVLHFPSAKENPGLLRVEGSAGLTVAPEAKYEGIFRLTPGPVVPEVHQLSRVETREGSLLFSSQLEFFVSHGEFGPITLRLAGWPGGNVHWEVPKTAKLLEVKPRDKQPTWVLHFPAGAPPRFIVKLSGQTPIPPPLPPLGKGGKEGSPKMSLPQVRLGEAHVKEHLVAVVGPQVQAEDPQGLASIKREGAKEWQRANWPWHTPPLSHASLWRAQKDEWNLNLVFKPGTPAPAVQVLLTEREAGLADGRRWVHQALYWLYVREATEWHVQLPPGANIVSVTRDQQLLAPRVLAPGQLVIPLPQPGSQVLRLQWLLDAEESVEMLRLDFPITQGESPVQKVLYVPEGYQISGQWPVASGQWSLAKAQHSLGRAHALFQLTEQLTQDGRRGENLHLLHQVQQRFYAYCRQAEYHLTRARLAGKEDRPLSARLEDLRRQNQRLARIEHYEKIRQDAQKETLRDAAFSQPFFSLAASGRWTLWSEDFPPALTVLADHRGREIFLPLIVAGMILLWLLSYWPRTLRVSGWFWPEYLLALTALGWLAFGMSLVGLLLVFSGLLARLVLVVLWGRAFFLRLAIGQRAESTLKPAP